MKRIFCMLLAMLMLVSAVVLCSCGEEEETSSVAEETSKVDDALVPTLGKTDAHNGKSLRVLSSYEENLIFCREPFGASESNAEPVNEACMERLTLLEQEYGIKVEAEFIDAWGVILDRVEQDYMTGTTNYDIVSTGLMDLANLASQGYFLDVYSIENSNLHLNESWWDSASHEDMTIANKLFFLTGDILVLDDEYTTCMFYNKGLINDNGLENPSDLVLNGTWTIDKLYEMAQTVASPGGDGVMDVTTDDTWGLVCVLFDTYKLVMGADAPQVIKNEQDLPELRMDAEYNISAFDKVKEIIKDKTVTAVREDFYAWDHADAPTVVGQFYNGRALFMANLISAVNSTDMREANISYGILPMPKYDETQENYATTNDPYHFYCVSIMQNTPDVEFVTFALEAMAYLGEKKVTPEYYDRTLKYKRFPDDTDSPEILDIIFSNRMVDISVAFNWDDCIQYYNNVMFGNGDVVSYVEGKRGAFEAAMQQTLDAFAAMEG